MLSNLLKVSLPVAALLGLTACETAQQPAVSFKSDIKPLLDHNCTECHNDGGTGTMASGLQTVNYELLMKGTKYGPVIVPGNAEHSTFYRLIAGKVDPSIQMPHGKEKLSGADIKKVENWIQQGAKNN